MLSSQHEFDKFTTNPHPQVPVPDDHFAYPNGVAWSTKEYSTFLDQPARSSSRNFVGTTDERFDGDGGAVVAMLSDPDFSVDDAPIDAFAISNGSNSAADLFMDTQFGVHHVQRYKSQLPDPPKHSVPSPTNPLNLRPDLASQRMNGVNGANMSLVATPQIDEASYMNHVIQPQSTQDFLDSWMDVLTSYQDEVWGDMLPLVQQAREEIQGAPSGANGTLQDHPAVNRLRMVLGHLDSSGMSSHTHNGVGHKPYQAGVSHTGSLNHQSQLSVKSVGEQALSTESEMQNHADVGLQQNLTNQANSQTISVHGNRHNYQAMWGRETQISMARVERRALVDFDKAAAIREAQDREHNVFRTEQGISQNPITATKHPEDPISDLEEEDHFVWYHRVDLRMSWAEVKQAYDGQFAERDQEDFRKSQWNYYRCLDACDRTKSNQSEQAALPQEEYRMRARTGLWYPWIRGHWL
ncbi:MAG: hypothetical protein LQ347_001083 [Umbilicaria vellea]|nr:MAG: hypothetical protein LQ347_001083 [Umbilicaria vellea]